MDLFIVGKQVRYLLELPSSLGDIRSQPLWYDTCNYYPTRTTAAIAINQSVYALFLRKRSQPSREIPYCTDSGSCSSCCLHVPDFPGPLGIPTESRFGTVPGVSLIVVACSGQHLEWKGHRVSYCDYPREAMLRWCNYEAYFS